MPCSFSSGMLQHFTTGCTAVCSSYADTGCKNSIQQSSACGSMWQPWYRLILCPQSAATARRRRKRLFQLEWSSYFSQHLLPFKKQLWDCRVIKTSFHVFVRQDAWYLWSTSAIPTQKDKRQPPSLHFHHTLPGESSRCLGLLGLWAFATAEL